MKMRLVKVKTTSYKEEDFLLVTDLTDKQIEKVITPIVMLERDNDESFYDNDMLTNELSKTYPKNFVDYYFEDNIDTITI